MKKKYRLTSNLDFQSIIKSKVQFVSRNLIIYYRKNDLKHIKLGISISKKMINAVNRNKIRRKIRAILIDLNKWDLEYDVVLIVRKAFLTKKFIEQKKCVKEIIERLENVKKD